MRHYGSSTKPESLSISAVHLTHILYYYSFVTLALLLSTTIHFDLIKTDGRTVRTGPTEPQKRAKFVRFMRTTHSLSRHYHQHEYRFAYTIYNYYYHHLHIIRIYTYVDMILTPRRGNNHLPLTHFSLSLFNDSITRQPTPTPKPELTACQPINSPFNYYYLCVGV